MQDGALRLEMTENGEPAPEVVDILRELRDRKKYFRLKDGSFLDLSEMDEWREMAEAAVGSETGEPEDEGKNARGVMEIATYRAAYMTSLLESGGIPVKVEDSVKNMVGSLQDDGEPCPAPLDQLLRPYQMRGFMWMQALDRLRMGGILADDMGLGKTLQVITLLLWAKRRGTRTRPPSSLRRRRWCTTGWRKSRNSRPSCAAWRARARRPSARRRLRGSAAKTAMWTSI